MKQICKVFSATCLISASTILSAATVIQDGREWMQLTTTTGISHSTMASNCLVTTGACTAGFNNDGDSLIGWKWADNKDVEDLFQSYITGSSGSPFYWTPTVTQPFRAQELSSLWGPEIFNSGFTATYSDNSLRRVTGITRELILSNISIAEAHDTIVLGPDQASVAGGFASVVFQRDDIGHWLYKDISAVPIPAALYLFSPVLLAMLGYRRKSKPT